MTKAEIRARQQTLRDAGFDIPVDGKDGEATRAAWDKYQNQRARADQARAAADQAKAYAEAEKAKSEAEATRAKAELERIQAAAKQRADEAAEKQREFERNMAADAEKEAREAREGLRKAGINAAALTVGIVGGLAYAKTIDAHRQAAVKAAAPKLAEVAKDARTVIKQYETGKNVPAAAKKLRGIVSAADKAKFTARAPIGIGPAAVLLVEGALSRFVIANQFEDPTAREAFQALGTTSAVAATTIIGKGTINVATPATPVNGRDLAAIESARTIADAEAKAVRARTPTPRNVAKSAVAKVKPTLRVAGGAAAIAIAGPAVAALTAFDATKSQALADGVSEGQATAQATGTAAVVGGGVAAAGYAIGKGVAMASQALAQALPTLSKIGAKALTPVALIATAAYAAPQGYREGGAIGAAVEAGKAMFDFGSMGLAPVVSKMLLPPEGQRTPAIVPRSVVPGRAYLNDAAARKAASPPVFTKPTGQRPAAAPPVSSNGMVKDYTRKDGTRVMGYKRAA